MLNIPISVNDFSEKAMPFISEIYNGLFPEDNSNAVDMVFKREEPRYNRFVDSLSTEQQDMLTYLETYLYNGQGVMERLEGFNGGFYIGFHLAMELLRGGERNG